MTQKNKMFLLRLDFPTVNWHCPWLWERGNTCISTILHAIYNFFSPSVTSSPQFLNIKRNKVWKNKEKRGSPLRENPFDNPFTGICRAVGFMVDIWMMICTVIAKLLLWDMTSQPSQSHVHHFGPGFVCNPYCHWNIGLDGAAWFPSMSSGGGVDGVILCSWGFASGVPFCWQK